MFKDKKFALFPAYIDKPIVISTLLLVIYGSIMIMSAEMGVAVGDTGNITNTVIKQCLFVILSVICMVIFSRFRLLNLRLKVIWLGYYAVLILLLSTRLFGSANGAYAWIRFGIFTIQPSEFAKVYTMVLGAKLLGRDHGPNNIRFLKNFVFSITVYFLIILLYQKDLGSAVVLAGIAFVMVLIPPYAEFNKVHFVMIISMFGIFALAFFLLSPIGTALLEKIGGGSYKIARFLASADPFAYLYDDGYHVVMGLVCFATGGLFGLGYGNSIHKYMNFPNPSNDFILPVIVEEMGIVLGLLPILGFYGIIFYRLYRNALAVEEIGSKMIIIGTIAYLALHFVLNVGGVSGLIPLTGVPLLLISSGGSSLMACLMAIGICQSEIGHFKKA